MARGLRVLGLLLAAERAAALKVHSEQPELFLPKEESFADPQCPFYQMCGEDCLGTPFMRKQMSREVKARIEAMKNQTTKIMITFSLLSDYSPDLALACEFGFKVHVWDPRPTAEDHISYIRETVGTNEPAHPLTAPRHEPCLNGCSQYWNLVASTKAEENQIIHHLQFSPGTGEPLMLHENAGGSYSVDKRKGIPGGDNVTRTTLDMTGMLNEAEIPRIDVMRIDYDGLEHTLLREVARLPERLLPEIIFIELPSFNEWTCHGERAECLEWKKDAKKLVREFCDKVGYSFQLYHKMDFIFMRLPPEQRRMVYHDFLKGVTE